MRGDLSGEGDLGWTVRSRRSSIWDSGPGAALDDAKGAEGNGNLVQEKVKRGLQGEGSYTWVAKVEEPNAEGEEWDDGGGELVKGLEEVVDAAGR